MKTYVDINGETIQKMDEIKKKTGIPRTRLISDALNEKYNKGGVNE